MHAHSMGTQNTQDAQDAQDAQGTPLARELRAQILDPTKTTAWVRRWLCEHELHTGTLAEAIRMPRAPDVPGVAAPRVEVGQDAAGPLYEMVVCGGASIELKIAEVVEFLRDSLEGQLSDDDEFADDEFDDALIHSLGIDAYAVYHHCLAQRDAHAANPCY